MILTLGTGLGNLVWGNLTREGWLHPFQTLPHWVLTFDAQFSRKNVIFSVGGGMLHPAL